MYPVQWNLGWMHGVLLRQLTGLLLAGIFTVVFFRIRRFDKRSGKGDVLRVFQRAFQKI